MSHLNPGLISAYNSLTDKHLSGYFNNTRIRRHLQRVGLITRSGRIVPDREYRHKLVQRAQQRHVRECLAQAIFHKVLEMERIHQIEIKRKLEEFARREKVHKIKVERSRRYEEEVIHILSPRPPTGPKVGRTRHSGPEGEHSESSESPGSSRPNTAPGQMQLPARLKPIPSSSTTASQRRRSPRRHQHQSSNDTDPALSYTVDGDPGRRRTLAAEFRGGVSPYCLPVINNFVTPVPPPTRKTERGPKAPPSSMLRGRRLRPTTAPGGPDINEESPMLRTSVHQTGVLVSMVYYGKTVHLSRDLADMRDEVRVFQQHCGGENLCVYKGKLHEGESFQLVSRRHRGFPFSLTLYVNGLQVERLSSCCEFKHRRGSRLGGRHGHFGVSGVKGASPCYRCIIAMGLDKKLPVPPERRPREEVMAVVQGRGLPASSPTGAPGERQGTSAVSSPDTARPEEVGNEVDRQGEKPRDDYEADFEADDEGVDEDTNVKQKNSPTPASRKEKKEKDRDVSDSDDDVLEEDRRSAVDHSSSGSSRESEDETEDETEDQTAEASHADVPPAPVRSPDKDEEEEERMEDPAAGDGGVPAAAEAQAQGSAEESTGCSELEALGGSGSSPSAGNEAGEDGDPSRAPQGRQDADAEDGATQEGEPERAKSVQEKLAEAILQPAQCSPGPELSDTSTEEEEASRDKDHHDKDATPEISVALVTEQHIRSEEDNCEDNAPATSKVEEKEGEATSEEKDQEDGAHLEPQENLERSTEEVQDKDEEAERDALPIDHTGNLKTNDEPEMADETKETPLCETEGEISEDPPNKPENPTDATAEEVEVEADEEEGGVPITAVEETQPHETEDSGGCQGGETSAPEPIKASRKAAAGGGEGGVAMVDTQSDGSPEEPGASVHEETPVGDRGEEREDSQESQQPGAPAEQNCETADDAEKTDASEAKAEGEPVESDVTEEAMEDESPQADVGVDETVDAQQDNQTGDKEDRENEAETQNVEFNSEVEVVKHEEDTEEMAERMENMENPRQKEEDKKDNKEEEHNTREDRTDEDEGNAEGNVNEELLEVESDMTIPDEGEDGESAQSQTNEYVSKTLETVEPVATTDKAAEGDGSSEEQADTKPGEEEVEKVNKALNHSSDGNLVEIEDGAKDDLVDKANGETITEDNAEGASGNPTESANVEGGQEESGGSENGVVDAENGETEAVEIQQSNEKEEDGAAATQDENDTGVKEGPAEVLSNQDIGEGKVDVADRSTDQVNTEEVEMESKAESAKHKGDKEDDKSGIIEDREDSTHSDPQVNKMDNAPRNSGIEEDNRGGAEEASKPSEGGASVVHKPQAEPSQRGPVEANQLTQSSALDKLPEETVDEHVATPEGLETEDNTVLVTKWVTLHQTSKYFEKFVEPLDDWNELPNAETSPYQNAQEIESPNVAEVARSSPHNIVTIPEHEADGENTEEVEPTQNIGDESKINNKPPDARSNNSKGDDTEDESKINNKVELVPPDIKSNTSKGDDTEDESKINNKVELVPPDIRSNTSKGDDTEDESKINNKVELVPPDIKSNTSKGDDTEDESKINNKVELVPPDIKSNTSKGDDTEDESKINNKVELVPPDIKSNTSKGDDTEDESKINNKVELVPPDVRSNTSKGDDTEDESKINNKVELVPPDVRSNTSKGDDTEDESKINNKVELVPPDIKSNTSKGDEPCESEATKYVQQDHMVNDFIQITDTDVMESTETREEVTGSEIQGPSGTLEKQQEEVALNTDPELNENQTIVEEIQDLQSLPKVEEHQEPAETPEGLSNLASVDVKPDEHEDTKEGSEKKEEDNRELTHVTDLTLTSMADDHEGDSQNGDISAGTLGESINGDNKDV